MVSHEIERFSIATSSAGALRGGGAACGDQQVQGQEEAQVTPPALVVLERMGRAHGQIYGMFHRIQGKPIVKSRFKNWKQ